MDAYRASVERLAQLESSEVFSNGKPEHALIIFETFLKHAKKGVLFFCRNLNPQVFKESLIEPMYLALVRGIRVEILTQETPSDPSFLAAVERWKSSHLPVSFNVVNHREVAAIKSNFTVMDGKAYRFEADRDEMSAVACMNDPKTATSLMSFFSKIKSAALPA
jgi:hypothetical protein